MLVLCEGWAFQYAEVSGEGRQILKFLIPGDVLTAALIFDRVSPLSVKALTAVRIGGFARSEIRENFRADPDDISAITGILAGEARDSAELAAMLGRCSAERRVAHLIANLVRRLAAGHVVGGQRYPFPLRRRHIADSVGLTTVHVSRVLGRLRSQGIISLSDGAIEVLDRQALVQLGSVRQ